jgi:signal transduction histidine kinase
MDNGEPQMGMRKEGGRDSSTSFASAPRASQAAIAEQVAKVIGHPVVKVLLETVCGHVLILNQQRQILAASPEFHHALATAGIHDFIGMRPGEALGCEHAAEGPGGCGTSRACAHCGAVVAILAAQCRLGPVDDECWLSMRRNHKLESVEFRARATPLALPEAEVIVVALRDISDRKRREALEQTFLHDARNLVGGILTWSEILQRELSEEAARSIRALAVQLRNHLHEHGLITQAEKGELLVDKAVIDLPALARDVNETLSHHPSGEGKNLVVRFASEGTPPNSDRLLLLRVLSNMVINALEASPAGATVDLHYESRDGIPTFTAHNVGVIPEAVAPRIFQRSFSTKSEPGHGLGTYSMRLLAEQYLGGEVTFTSAQENGTTFTLILPAK